MPGPAQGGNLADLRGANESAATSFVQPAAVHHRIVNPPFSNRTAGAARVNSTESVTDRPPASFLILRELDDLPQAVLRRRPITPGGLC